MVGCVIHKEGSGATNKPKWLVMLAQHHYKALSPALCSHNLSLLDAGQSPHQISSKTCQNHSSISMLHSKYFPHPYKPCGSHLFTLSAADTHYVQHLISSWKAGNAAQISKALVDIKNQSITSCTADFDLR